MAVLPILFALYAFFGGMYYAYRRGLFGDGSLLVISMLLLAAIGAWGWPHLVTTHPAATVARSSEPASFAAIATSPPLAVSESAALK